MEDVVDVANAPTTITVETTVAPESTIAADARPTATPFSARMIANSTAAQTSSSADRVSTPVSISTGTPSRAIDSTPAPVAVATEEPVVEVTVAPSSSGVEIMPSQIGAIDWGLTLTKAMFSIPAPLVST